MRVKAIKAAFYGGSRVGEGDTLILPDGAKLAKWMVIVAPREEPAKKGKGKTTRKPSPEQA